MSSSKSLIAVLGSTASQTKPSDHLWYHGSKVRPSRAGTGSGIGQPTALSVIYTLGDIKT